MNTRFIYFVICLILINCKEPQPQLTFKYADQPVVVNCNQDYNDLINEALHHFEAILNDNYTNKNPSLASAYNSFIRESTTNKTNYNNISNQHALDIYEALKHIDGLWVQKNNELTLNYNHEIFSCINNNLTDKDLKSTYNALLVTNSMSIRMFKDALTTKSSRCTSDKYLATFVALELYYSKLAQVDLSKKQEKGLEPNLKEDKDSHAGHNHD